MSPKEQALLDAVKRLREARTDLETSRAGLDAVHKAKQEADDAYDRALTSERDAEAKVKTLIDRLLTEDA